MNNLLPPLIAAVAGLIVGFGVGFMSHKLTSRREREARQEAARSARDAKIADYEAVLLRWEQRVEVLTDPERLKNIYFSEMSAELRPASAKVRRDMKDRAAFDDLESVVTRLHGKFACSGK